MRAGTILKCEPKSPVVAHPCVDAALNTNIQDGSLQFAKKINKKRSSYDVVCADGTINGRVRCVDGDFRPPFWNKEDWENSCVGKIPEDPCLSEDPCSGLSDCEVIVSACPVNPVQNTVAQVVTSSLKYYFSADVYCDSSNESLYGSGEWQNIFHVTAGSDKSAVGARTFTLFRDEAKSTLIRVGVTHPLGTDFETAITFTCTAGEWFNIKGQVGNTVGDGSWQMYDVYMNGNQLFGGYYEIAKTLPAGQSLSAFVSNNWSSAASGSLVKNFIYKKL